MGRQTLRARSLALIFRFRVNVPGCIRNISAVQYANEVVHELGSADAIVGIYVEEVGVDRLPHGRLQHLQPLGIAGLFRETHVWACVCLHLAPLLNAGSAACCLTAPPS